MSELQRESQLLNIHHHATGGIAACAKPAEAEMLILTGIVWCGGGIM